MTTHELSWPGLAAEFSHGVLQVSENGHFLQHADSTPFFWMGDTAWELFHRLNRGEAEYFLETRRRQGFNLIQAVALAEFEGLRAPNRYGALPFEDLNPAKPNELYWQHVDWVIDCAAKKGLYIGLLPTWGDKVVRETWGDGPIIFDEQNARHYGAWLGRRYGQRPNIVWILGGDRPSIWQGRDGKAAPVDYRPLWRAMSAGLDAGMGRHTLTSYHTSGHISNRTALTLHPEPWLDVNMMQSGHGSGHDTPLCEAVQADFALQPAKPTLDSEPNYEDHPVNPWPTWDPQYGYFRDHDVRKQLYRSVFAGGCGVTYGHHAMWQFYDPAQQPVVNFADRPWREAIVRPGAQQVIHLRRLMESLPYFTRVPDDSVIAQADLGQLGNRLCATRDSAGHYALVYVPNTQTVTVRMDVIASARVVVRWYDPRTGATTEIGTFANTGTRFFTPPDHGPDWVLLMRAGDAGG